MPHLNPTIVHVDDAVIVADKPAGLLSMPARGEARQDCLVSRVQQLYPDALLVHRLDMATSGLIMLARGHEMLRRMNLAFEQRIVGKKYCAVVHGHMADERGEITLPLGCDPDNPPRQKVDPVHGRAAKTRYRVLARSGEGGDARTRVELTLLTGRTHQLRVHLMSIGHPIIGDPLYAPPDEAEREPRMCLHSTSLAFIHPRTRVPACFDSAVPF
ncbi:RluA family pseudouridine synthase [Zoogloea sp.]|uniref:RluA family pseudouridine synthase n=1 Tax=Zoogloea sp. TaxID=49181 RepID=UPI00141656E0|nr:MAG: RluA family pseudouridine synthase [Zoogloea sp.]